MGGSNSRDPQKKKAYLPVTVVVAVILGGVTGQVP